MIHISNFQDLSGQQVYEFLRLRQDVFVLEQHCLYEDIDGRDHYALHALYTDENEELLGCLRILPPANGSKLSIGRVVVKKSARNRGIGRALMEAALKVCQTRYPGEEIKISAQTYLIDFYASFGFQPFGGEYLEAGLPHQGMILKND